MSDPVDWTLLIINTFMGYLKRTREMNKAKARLRILKLLIHASFTFLCLQLLYMRHVCSSR